MDRVRILELLNNDLKNEWKHLRFYLYHASTVVGLHREEYRELFLKEAAGEMAHVTEFSDLIIGLGGVPTSESNDFEKFTNPVDIIRYAVGMEEEVVSNYAMRMYDANCFAGDTGDLPSEEIKQQYADGKWLEIFLEGQIQKSREDVDNFKQILRGISPV